MALDLDFTINSAEERAKASASQVDGASQKELETIADYILWGDKENGNVIGVKSKVWKSQNEPESLDSLLESPAFTESMLYRIGELPKTIKKKPKFSRAEARANLSPSLLGSIESLWKEIDALDLITSLYSSEKVRESLLARFTPEEIDAARAYAARIPQYLYLKMRRLLIEKRRQQYTFKDTYSSRVMRHTPEFFSPVPDISFEILPCGGTFFAANGLPSPETMDEAAQKKVSDYLWATPSLSPLKFDFRDPDHVSQLITNLAALTLSPEFVEFDSQLPELRDALFHYIEIADLTPAQHFILEKKIAHASNQEIAEEVNTKFQKSYNPNYISTIFHQKIIPQINDAAAHHREVLENIFFPENFKKCKDCGRTLLVSPRNFVRKAKSKDGFSSRCKQCEHKRRKEKEEK